MSTLELKRKLIEKIEQTENPVILEEAYRLLGIESENLEIYKLNNEQKKVVREAQNEIKAGKFISEEQANRETDK